METLAELLELQSGVLSRRQVLAAPGESEPSIRRRLRRRTWVAIHPGVYVDHTGPPTWLQRAWAAVLYAWPAALYGDSAIRACDGPGRRERRDDGPVHVAIAHSRTVWVPAGPTAPGAAEAAPALVVHRVRRFHERVLWTGSPPRMRMEHAVLQAATSRRDRLAVVQALADAVQSRRTTAARLEEALADWPRYPDRDFVAGVLDDIAQGACSVLEHGYLSLVERAHGLPRADRQVRASARGPVHRDVVHRRQGLVVELDGRLFHDSARSRDLDMDRDLDAAVDGLSTVRIGWGQVYRRPCRTAVRIGTLLQQRGWTGAITSCPQCAARAA